MFKIDLQKINEDSFQFTQTESIVYAIWVEVLQEEEIGPEDNFFGLGGDSLMSMIVIFRVKDELNVELPPGSIYKSPTLREFSQLIDDRLDALAKEKITYNESQFIEEETGAL
jgi:myxalamid-type nonribosomal peptide synthetase MxaA